MILDRLHAFNAVPSPKGGHSHASFCTLVFTKNSGKRLVFHKELVEALGLTDEAKIAYNTDGLWVGKDLPGIEVGFPLRDIDPGKKVVYSSALIKDIIEKLGIEMEGKTSCNFYSIKLEQWEGDDIACLNIKEGDTDG